MKVLFAGPSLAADIADLARRHPDVRFAGPVARGDVAAAIQAGAAAIGIVDGVFRDVPPVWHKEILHALSLGVAVAGGASMGALRAAECSPFGMVGIGAVHELIATGAELDDACVAQVHAPAALGWAPLSEAWVTVDATIAGLRRAAVIDEVEADALDRANRALHYAERTLPAVAATARLDPARRDPIAAALRAGRVDIKRTDALLVLDWLLVQPDVRVQPPADWRMAETSQWLAFLAETRSGGPEHGPCPSG